MSNINWEAEKYASNFNFVPQYGKDLFKLITCPKGSRVLDLGCGNGTLTCQLADAGYEVEGIDASSELIALARKQHPDLIFREADATNFTLKEPVDMVFSNAVFHWIDSEKQSSLLEHIALALKTGGELVCEFGGSGNNAMIHNALANAFAKRDLTYKMPFFFPTIGAYTPLMEQAGLQVRFAALFDRFTELSGENGLYDWIQMFVKLPFAGMDNYAKDTIINEAVNELKPILYVKGHWYADYVRLRLRAVKI